MREWTSDIRFYLYEERLITVAKRNDVSGAV